MRINDNVSANMYQEKLKDFMLLADSEAKMTN